MANPHDSSVSITPSSDASHPLLPPELEREIFEVAAVLFPRRAPILVLVARRVRQWYVRLSHCSTPGETPFIPASCRIEPLLYDILVVSSRFNSYPLVYRRDLLYNPIKMPLFDRATGYARHVLLEGVKTKNAAEVLQRCDKVENLGLWGLWASAPFNDQRHLLPLIQSCSMLKRLSASPADLLNVKGVPFEFDHTVFTKLTHLEILCMNRRICQWKKWGKLALLPRLTHVAIDFSTPQFVQDLLDGCSNLKLVVLFYEDREEILEQADDMEEDGVRNAMHPGVGVMTDGRVVQMPEVHDWIEDWERGARGEEDFWTRAENIQAESSKNVFLSMSQDTGKMHSSFSRQRKLKTY